MSDFIDIGDRRRCMIVFSRPLDKNEIDTIREKFADIINRSGVKYIVLENGEDGILFGTPIFEQDSDETVQP